MPKKECLAYHLGNCQAPCVGKVTKEEYRQNMENLSKVLGGNDEAEEVRKKLEEKMKDYSMKEDYENAKNTRDQINSLDIFFNKQKIERPQNHRDEDYIWIEKTQSEIFFQIIKSRNGVLSKSEKHAIKINDQERAESLFLYNYYEVDQETIIYSNLDVEEREFLNKIFESDKFREIPKSKEKIIEIARNSLNQNEIEISVRKLREELKLEKDPIVIETFDISTLFGENNVASMVQFVNGRSNKKEYRKFMIKSIEKQDDFASMKEVVYRRYSRLVSENKPFPDLIVIDGGIGQLHAAIEGLKEANVNIVICSLAKQFEEVFMPGRMNSIKMDKKNPALKLLQMGRDEAHRFALTFQRLRRKKKMIEKD
jgi:excinuclease ABC subunit C